MLKGQGPEGVVVLALSSSWRAHAIRRPTWEKRCMGVTMVVDQQEAGGLVPDLGSATGRVTSVPVPHLVVVST